MSETEVIEPWREAWREGFSPLISTNGLEALAKGLREDDQRLIQRSVSFPSHLHYQRHRAVCGACAVAYCAWQGDDLQSVGEVGEFFNMACHKADKRLGVWGACGWFLNWFDDTPREQMIRELLPEVELALAGRKE